MKGEIKKEGWQNTTPPFYWANMESKHQSIKFFGYLYKMSHHVHINLATNVYFIYLLFKFRISVTRLLIAISKLFSRSSTRNIKNRAITAGKL